MTLTLLDLSERVWTHVRDDDHEFITSEDVKAWLNDAQSELSARLDLIRRESSASTDGTNLIVLPTDNLRVLSLRLGTDDVEFVDDDIFNAWADQGDTPARSIGRIFAGNIELYPTPDDLTDYVLRYAAMPAEMDSDDDVPELPAQWHPHLTYFAIAQAFAKEKDVYMADRWLMRWEEGLPQMPLGREALDPGPMNFVYQTGPFDVSDGDDGPIHR